MNKQCARLSVGNIQVYGYLWVFNNKKQFKGNVFVAKNTNPLRVVLRRLCKGSKASLDILSKQSYDYSLLSNSCNLKHSEFTLVVDIS